MSSDLPLAEKWTAADLAHAGMDPRFWTQQGLGMDSYLLEDATGPIFFFRAHVKESRVRVTVGEKEIKAAKRIAEIHIQFGPVETQPARIRVYKALMEGMTWLLKMFEQAGVEEIYFDSSNDDLIHFCRKRLGFTLLSENASTGDCRLRRHISRPEPAHAAYGKEDTSHVRTLSS